jgi:hypothetical protein
MHLVPIPVLLAYDHSPSDRICAGLRQLLNLSYTGVEPLALGHILFSAMSVKACPARVKVSRSVQPETVTFEEWRCASSSNRS